MKRSGRPRPQFPVVLFLSLLVAALCAATARSDEPYAPSRDYDLRRLRTHLWFDVDRRQVKGEVNEGVTLLRDGVAALKFDSVGLTIAAVTVDGKPAKFSTGAEDLTVSLDAPAKRGDQHEVFIQYQGQPKAGLYFILPDDNYPHQPREVWTQGEAEDTRYYIPLYDYPNDRVTSEMLLTVPAAWITVSNGRLADVHEEPNGMRTWDWKESQPISTYLISAIAGDFVERDDSWRGIPLRYVVPRGEEGRIDPSFARTKQMLDAFSDKLGVPFPWEQYAQTSVDDFTEGGMENASATTFPVSQLVDPGMAGEYRVGPDDTQSHELAHQWFGDLVTCKDWANLWLNEGFATYFQHYWLELRYNTDDSAYAFWRDQRQWFRQTRLYPVPIVDRNFTDSTEYAGNVYTKGGWVLKMLRHTLGDAAFFSALHQYLEDNRGKNVVTADLQKSIEQATGVNVDQFFGQWIFRAGAPRFEVHDSYDPAAHLVTLDVAQTQKIEGSVGLFDVPVTVEITTANGRQAYPIRVSQGAESFSFPADSAPLMILFDKGDEVLKSIDFHKEPAELIYQLKYAQTVPDRADAALALGAIGNNTDVVTALGDAAQNDPFWGIRVEALRALGRLAGGDAEKQILARLNEPQPWVREVAVAELGHFKQDSSLSPKIEQIASNDPAYRVRATALGTLADLAPPDLFKILESAIRADSPDDVLRIAALGAMGRVNDPRAAALLLDWSAPGKPFEVREAAIAAVATNDRANKDITRLLVSYLTEPYFDIQMASIAALGERDDPEAIAPIEALLRGDTLTVDERPHFEHALANLRRQAAK
jgi:aminopeptidase N